MFIRMGHTRLIAEWVHDIQDRSGCSHDLEDILESWPNRLKGGCSALKITSDSTGLVLKGKKGGRAWAKEGLRSRIDAIVAHEWAEAQSLDHREALKAAARTKLAVSDGARRILKAMAR